MKKVWIGVLIVIAYTFFVFNPVIIDNSVDIVNDEIDFDYQKSETENIFNQFDFNKDDWKVCVIIKDRIQIFSKIPYGTYLTTSDIQTIKKFKGLSFTYTASDMATVENQIIFYRNKKWFLKVVLLSTRI